MQKKSESARKKNQSQMAHARCAATRVERHKRVYGELNATPAYGSSALAEKWRKHDAEANDRLASSLETISQDVRQYCAGMFDGDGNIDLDLGPHGASLSVYLYQSRDGGEPPELLHFQSVFGGTIACTRASNGRWRRAWRLKICGRLALLVVLTVIKDHSIVKAPQAVVALNFLLHNSSAYDCVAKLGEAKDFTASLDVPEERLSSPYIAGLWAAEGSVIISKLHVQVNLSQKCCPSLLIALRKRFRGHVSTDGKWTAAANVALEFLDAIRGHVKVEASQKANQIAVVDEYTATIASIGKFKDMEKKKEIAVIAKENLKKLKKQ